MLKRLLVALFVGAALLVAAAPASAASYYFANDGSDYYACTSTKPCRTLAEASGLALNPGDRVLLKRGHVFSGPLTVNDIGTSTNYIVVTTWGDSALAKPLIYNRAGMRCVVLAGQYIRASQLHAQSCGPNGTDSVGFRLEGSNNRVTYSEADDNYAGFQAAAGGTGAVISRNHSHHNDKWSENTCGPPVESSGGFGVLLNGTNATVSQNRLENNVFPSCAFGDDGAAVEIFGSSGNLILRNEMVNNNVGSEVATCNPPATPCPTAQRLSTNNEWRYNIVYSTRDAGGQADPSDHTTGFTFHQSGEYGPTTNNRVYNNTIYLNPTSDNGQGVVCGTPCESDRLTMKQNILRVEDGPGVDGKIAFIGATTSQAVIDYNLYWGNGAREFTCGMKDLGCASPGLDPKLFGENGIGIPITTYGSAHNFELLCESTNASRYSPALDYGLSVFGDLDVDGSVVPLDAPNGPSGAGDRDTINEPDLGAQESRGELGVGC
jgi:hypothetical protein